MISRDYLGRKSRDPLLSLIDRPKFKRGCEAEDLALKYLLKKGLRLITRNYHSRSGEIDLIMEDREFIVFIEVRYRKTVRFGGPLESVDRHKQFHLIQCARHYLSCKHINRPARFDVIGITPGSTDLDIQWVPDAFHA